MLRMILLVFCSSFISVNSSTTDDTWKWNEMLTSITTYAICHNRDYEVQLVFPQKGGGEHRDFNLELLQVKIIQDGKLLHQWDSCAHGAFCIVGSIVVYSDNYDRNSPINTLFAFDLAQGKQIWEAEVKGFEINSWSQCSEASNLRAKKGKVTVYGKDLLRGGRYIETIDIKTGTLVSHKILRPEDQEQDSSSR